MSSTMEGALIGDHTPKGLEGPEGANGLNGLFMSGKSLKKKKSLKQLFIPSRQKSFQHRSVSSPENQQSISSPLEAPPLPSNARGLSTAPPKTFSIMFNERKIADRELDPDILRATNTLWPVKKPAPEVGTRERAHTMHDTSRSSVLATKPSVDREQTSLLPRQPLPGSPGLMSPRTAEVSSSSLQRFSTEIAHQGKRKPGQYAPVSLQNPQIPAKPQTATFAVEPRSPGFSPATIQSHSAHLASYEGNKSIESPLPAQCQRVPWNPVDGVRGSYTSAQSTSSSYVDSTTTKRSSVFTKNSAFSDTTLDAESAEGRRHSMTVEETIEMYAKGFEDDPPERDLKRQSTATAGPHGVSNAPLLKPTETSYTGLPKEISSAAVVSDGISRDRLYHPPSLRKPTALHDQYGFKKESRDITLEAYDAWYANYLPFQERRDAKWLNFLQSHGLPTKNTTQFPVPSAKTQRFIRKGISPSLRGEAWFFYARGNDLMKSQPQLYSELVMKSKTSALVSKDKEAIERDLHRTFPENIHFKPGLPSLVGLDGQPVFPTEEPLIVSALRRLLSAFAIHHPAVGYCQSLNFIAGLLLLFLPEDKAFWMLHIITSQLLPGSHEESLEGTDIDTWVLMLALKDQNPSLWSKIGGDVQSDTRYLPDISMCTTSWFMSAFIGNLPIECVLRVWDVLFYEGSKTLFRVALAIFKIGEEEIKRIQDPMETLQVIQTLPRKMLDVGRLFEIAFSRGEVGKRWIEKKRQERKDYHIQRRATEKARRESRDVVRKDSDTKSMKDMHLPSMIDEHDPMPAVHSASTKSRHMPWHL